MRALRRRFPRAAYDGREAPPPRPARGPQGVSDARPGRAGRGADRAGTEARLTRWSRLRCGHGSSCTLPVGAGGHSVRQNWRVFEAVVARLEKRARYDLYRSALTVQVPAGAFVIELAPSPDRKGSARGVVAEDPVGSRRASAPTPVWGRDGSARPDVGIQRADLLAAHQERARRGRRASSGRLSRRPRLARRPPGRARSRRLSLVACHDEPPRERGVERAGPEGLVGDLDLGVARGGDRSGDRCALVARYGRELVLAELDAPE
jgi:hypothetical protein